MTVPSYTAAGTKQAGCAVPADVFGLKETNHRLVKAAYENYLDKKRANLAKVKTRGLVRGGGRKPWQQKGTGRARVGSIRSPLWRGGGVIFGPTGRESYVKKLNKKAKALALRQALTLKKDRVAVLQALPEDGKTATLDRLLYGKLKLNRRVLLVDARTEGPAKRAARNLAEVELIDVNYLNVFRVMNADWLVFTAKALDSLKGVKSGEED
ncbi:50S ribosomal protein L4 [Candidatus Saccharibacteria bacterium]|nr:50S ribosomal protein L4 [Candidatus Saccharibacteria bacterium]